MRVFFRSLKEAAALTDDGSSVFVSNGPHIESWAATFHVPTLGGERFATGIPLMPSGLLVHSKQPLREVAIYDGRRLFRRITFGDAEHEYNHTLLLEGFVQRNLVVIATDATGGKAMSFPRRSFKAGLHSVQFCTCILRQTFFSCPVTFPFNRSVREQAAIMSTTATPGEMCCWRMGRWICQQLGSHPSLRP